MANWSLTEIDRSVTARISLVRLDEVCELQNSVRRLVLGDEDAVPDDAQPVAGTRFALSGSARSRTVRRLWLDTFDWRLYRSGLTLEQVSDRGATELVLTGRDGRTVTAERLPARVRWPARADSLPHGPLRDHLGRAAGIRALLPVARAVSVVRDRRALNSDDKTIAWVSVDRMSVTYPAAAELPQRLGVTPVRGYESQAARITDRLAARPGVADGDASALQAALAAAGRRPGDYTGKIDVALTPRMPAAAALAAVLTSLLDTLEANVPGTLRDIDTEFLHDLRVAVRRTRSALKLAGDVLPAGQADRFGPEFKWLGDLTTPTRDLDVYLLGYPAMAGGLLGASAAELEPFREVLAARRAAAQRALARGLRSARFSRLMLQWRAALETAAARPGGPAAGKLAASRIGKAHRRVLKAGGAITAASPPESLHTLRKRCKELRYLLEFFASLYDPGQLWRAVRELKDLQDCLGEFQDTQVQQEELRAFAAQMMRDRAAPAATLLAMGEIAADLAARQRKARREFSGRFRDFASPASQGRIRALTGASA